MCGRYSVQENAGELMRLFGRAPPTDISPNDDLRPMNSAPIIRLDGQEQVEWAQARWGLIPSWSKTDKLKYSTFNARAETVATASSFREAFKGRHCLVPVSSFFEWPVLEGKKKKIRISMLDGKPFCFAGLWEHWRNPGSEGPPELTTFTIITCDANEDMAQYHNRMPVIVEEQNYQWWLEAGAENPHALLVPYLNGKLKIEPV